MEERARRLRPVPPNLSTCLGRPGFYPEDLCVGPALRGSGAGRTTLVGIAAGG